MSGDFLLGWNIYAGIALIAAAIAVVTGLALSGERDGNTARLKPAVWQIMPV
jgi:hypothetical protein